MTLDGQASLGRDEDGVAVKVPVQSEPASTVLPISDSKPIPKEDQGLKNFFRILSYATPLDAVLMVFAALCAAGTGIAMPAMIIFYGRLVNGFNSFFSPDGNNSNSSFANLYSKNSEYIVFLWIGKFVLGYVSTFVFRLSGLRISATIRKQYMEALLKQPVASLDKLPPGVATDNLGRAANTIQLGISEKLASLVQSLALTISGFVIAFVYSWELTLALSSSFVFIVIVYSGIVYFWIRFEAEMNHANSKASGLAGEAIKNIRTVKALGAEDDMFKRHHHWIAEAQRIGMRMTPLTALQISPAFFAMYSALALALWLGVKMYISGSIGSLLEIVVSFSSVLLVVGALGGLIGPLQGIVQASAASISLFRVIDAPQRSTSGLKEPQVDGGQSLLFSDIHFSYPGRPLSEVLKGVNLHILAGRTTAICGPSGGGKSTIVGLAERWYQLSDVNERLSSEGPEKTQLEKVHEKMEEQKAKKEAKKLGKKDTDVTTEPEDAGQIFQNSGSINLGDHNIEELDLKWWRSQIGLVQQEPHLFNESILENVSAGLTGSRWENEPAEVKRRLVEEACKEAFADEFIRRLPEGYDTEVGESGIQLSGGQRQRLAIARAVIKRPKILILDEATSSVDVRAERIVQRAINRVAKNRTTIMIAHRLSTIKTADQIVVMKEGRIVEAGSHDELLNTADGAYAQMVLAQKLDMHGDEALEKEAFSEVVEEADEAIPEKAEEQQTPDQESPLQKVMLRVLGFGRSDDKGPQRSAVTALRSVGRILGELRQQNKLIYVLVVIAACGGGAVYSIQSYLLSHFLTVFIEPKGPRMLHDGSFWALMLFILALVILASYGLLSSCMNVLSVRTAAKYSGEYFRSMVNKDIPWFDDDTRSSGSLTAQLSNDPKQLQQFIGVGISIPLVSVTGIIGCVIIAFYFGWKLSLVVFCTAFPVILAASAVRVRYELTFAEYNTRVFVKSSKFAAESISSYRTVTALTIEEPLRLRYETLLHEHLHAAFKKARLACLVISLSDSIDLLCVALATGYGGILLARREYGPLQFYIIYYALIQGGQACGQFLGFIANVGNGAEAANRIVETRGEAGTEEDTAAQSWPVEQSEKSGLRIDFEDVAFRYPSRNIPVYAGLNLSIRAGEYVAIVGPSGCGKTTIISLLSRFYSKSEGRIFVDGQDIQSIPIADYRQAVSLVSQEPTLFEGTVRQNLVLGLPKAAEVTASELQDACNAADIGDFVASLPQGFETQLTAGTHSSLSGGQKQRLCVARALLRKPRLLLLDEATSSLDSKSEGVVQKAVENIAQNGNVTIVAVAHRLATVQRADRIVLLGQGGVVLEMGSHAELVARRGVYWDMCRAQALG